jgi:hypothetical protein
MNEDPSDSTDSSDADSIPTKAAAEAERLMREMEESLSEADDQLSEEPSEVRQSEHETNAGESEHPDPGRIPENEFWDGYGENLHDDDIPPEEVYADTPEPTDSTGSADDTGTDEDVDPSLVDRDSLSAEQPYSLSAPPVDDGPHWGRGSGKPGRGAASHSRRRGIDDDEEMAAGYGYETPNRTQVGPFRDDDTPSAAQERKRESLSRVNEERNTEMNAKRKELDKMRYIDHVAGQLELSRHFRGIVKNAVYELDLSEWGSWPVEFAVLATTSAVVRRERMRHHFSYRPGDQRIPEDFDITKLSLLSDDSGEFRDLMESADMSPNQLKRATKKVKQQIHVPDPESAYQR